MEISVNHHYFKICMDFFLFYMDFALRYSGFKAILKSLEYFFKSQLGQDLEISNFLVEPLLQLGVKSQHHSFLL